MKDIFLKRLYILTQTVCVVLQPKYVWYYNKHMRGVTTVVSVVPQPANAWYYNNNLRSLTQSY
jgi:hypothetical protein